jgi:hypothetical protein
MSRIAFVTWNGGGNLGPALAIARELERRGHQAVFLGHDSQRPAIEAAGHAFTGYTPRSRQAGPPANPAERQRLLLSGTWLNTSLADDLVAMLARDPAGIVVIDCMLAGVLARSAEFGAPTAVLVPGLYHCVLPVRDAMLQAGLQLMAQADLPVPDPAAMKWENKDLVLVTSLHELDGVGGGPGPQRALRRAGVCLAARTAILAPAVAGGGSPAADPGQPQHHARPDHPRSPAARPRCAGTPARPGADDHQHRPARHPHPGAERGGHRLAAAPGDPAPRQPHDHPRRPRQRHRGTGPRCPAGVHPRCWRGPPVIAARAEALGAGQTVSPQAPASELRDAARHVLATRSCQQAARRLARIIGQHDGAANGASALEDYAAQPATWPHPAATTTPATSPTPKSTKP